MTDPRARYLEILAMGRDRSRAAEVLPALLAALDEPGEFTETETRIDSATGDYSGYEREYQVEVVRKVSSAAHLAMADLGPALFEPLVELGELERASNVARSYPDKLGPAIFSESRWQTYRLALLQGFTRATFIDIDEQLLTSIVLMAFDHAGDEAASDEAVRVLRSRLTASMPVIQKQARDLDHSPWAALAFDATAPTSRRVRGVSRLLLAPDGGGHADRLARLMAYEPSSVELRQAVFEGAVALYYTDAYQWLPAPLDGARAILLSYKNWYIGAVQALARLLTRYGIEGAPFCLTLLKAAAGTGRPPESLRDSVDVLSIISRAAGAELREALVMARSSPLGPLHDDASWACSRIGL